MELLKLKTERQKAMLDQQLKEKLVTSQRSQKQEQDFLKQFRDNMRYKDEQLRRE